MQLEIRRIDHCADMDVSIEKVRSSLIVKRKRKRSDYDHNETTTGLQFGKGSEVISIYNKALQLKEKGRTSNHRGEHLTRFEVSQKQKKIKYNRVSQLDNYLLENPFSKLIFYKLDKPNSVPDDLPLRDRIFLEMVMERGLHSTYKILNQHNNFSRDHKSKLVETEFSAMIKDKYHKSLREFITGEINDQKYTNKK